MLLTLLFSYLHSQLAKLATLMEVLLLLVASPTPKLEPVSKLVLSRLQQSVPQQPLDWYQASPDG